MVPTTLHIRPDLVLSATILHSLKPTLGNNIISFLKLSQRKLICQHMTWSQKKICMPISTEAQPFELMFFIRLVENFALNDRKS